MSLFVTILELAALAVLGGYLFWQHERRVRARQLLGLDPAIWVGHGIDAATLQPRVHQVRCDHLAVLRGQARRFSFQKACVRRARGHVGRMGYFRGLAVAENGSEGRN